MNIGLKEYIDNYWDNLVNVNGIKPPIVVRFRKGLPEDLMREINEYINAKNKEYEETNQQII